MDRSILSPFHITSLNKPKKSSLVALLLGLLFISADLVFLNADPVQAQQRGVPTSQQFRLAEGIVRISEPGQIADTVNVWGDINAPGRYMVPRGTRVHELISYARGPNTFRSTETAIDWSKLRLEVNISRYDQEKGLEEIRSFKFRYNEPYPAELREYQLQNDEIVSLEIKRRAGLPDYLRVIGPAVTAISTTILIFQRL